VLVGFALLTVVSLVLMALRVRRRGGLGRRSGAILRSVYPPVLGLGGWCLAALTVLTALPHVPVNDVVLTAVSVGLPVGWSVYLTWVQRDKSRRIGLAAALAGALAGAWLGYLATDGVTALLTTVVGATVGANALVLALDMLASARTHHTPPSAPLTDEGTRRVANA